MLTFYLQMRLKIAHGAEMGSGKLVIVPYSRYLICNNLEKNPLGDADCADTTNAKTLNGYSVKTIHDSCTAPRRRQLRVKLKSSTR